MNVITYPRTVYIVDGDPDLSLSSKFLLESRNCLVQVFKKAEDFVKENNCRETDVILLDLNQNKPAMFRLLNRLMFAVKRPRIVITTDTESALRPDDIFPGERIQVLVHPVAPKELVRAIEAVE